MLCLNAQQLWTYRAVLSLLFCAGALHNTHPMCVTWRFVDFNRITFCPEVSQLPTTSGARHVRIQKQSAGQTNIFGKHIELSQMRLCWANHAVPHKAAIRILRSRVFPSKWERDGIGKGCIHKRDSRVAYWLYRRLVRCHREVDRWKEAACCCNILQWSDGWGWICCENAFRVLSWGIYSGRTRTYGMSCATCADLYLSTGIESSILPVYIGIGKHEGQLSMRWTLKSELNAEIGNKCTRHCIRVQCGAIDEHIDMDLPNVVTSLYYDECVEFNRYTVLLFVTKLLIWTYLIIDYDKSNGSQFFLLELFDHISLSSSLV